MKNKGTSKIMFVKGYLGVSKGEKIMKFDFVIGNPPYNEEFGGSGENETYAAPVYNKFIDAANTISDRVELVHPARFLFNVGSTPKAWNEKMLRDKHLKILHYEADSKVFFSNTKIRGGICISYHDNNMDFGAIEVFTPYPLLNSITKKVRSYNGFSSITQIMYIQNRFNLDAMYRDYPHFKVLIGSDGKDKRFETGIFEKIPLFVDEKKDDDIAVYGVIKKKRCFKYFPIKYTEIEHENLYKYKVVTMKSNGEGVFGEAMAPFDILKPLEAFTRSYISIGAFDDEYEAVNCRKYLKTKFSRVLLYVKKVTQDNPIDAWICIPIQDFTDNSDINWSATIPEIDKQLYKKYDLSDEEINFIETKVKEMA